MQPSQELLDELVRRIIETVDPLQIILFGSAVRGDMTPDSDLDMLVVVPEGVHRLDATERLHRAMLGLHMPKDFIVTTPRSLEKYKNNSGMIYQNALLEGRALYHV